MATRLVIVGYFHDFSEVGFLHGAKEYTQSYRDFAVLCRRNNIDFYVARERDYAGRMKFSTVFRLTATAPRRVSGPIHSDIIYDKNTFSKNFLRPTRTGVIVNDPSLDQIARDKYLTYQIFGTYMSKTYPIDQSNWRAVLKKIRTSNVVIKPVFGTEGRGIVVTEKSRVDYAKLDQSHAPFMAQEFIDSSYGIAGLVKGFHDLRLFIFNGEIKLAYIRQPKRGSVLANIAQGGSVTIVPLARVPQSARHFLGIVEQELKKYFPRIYTIDVMYEGDTPYIVELNSKPGLPYKAWETYDHFYSKFHRYLLETLLSSQKL